MTEAELADLDSLDKETLKTLLIRERRSNAIEIEHLKLVIEKLRRMLFGVKSEKLTGELEQLELRLEELETSEAAEEAAEEKNTEARSTDRERRRPRRKPLPEDLPRTSSCICPSTTAALIAVARCVSSAKMSASSWNASRQPSR
jgi:hypothetical protein